jgi:uncharacterized protein YndB with AHSA1/START domain
MDTTDATTERMGTVLSAGDTWTLRYERRIDHPVDKVWRAITEREHLQHWLPCDVVGERTEGAALELVFWPGYVERYAIEQPVLTGRITVWQPPEVFEWWWDHDRLRWELEATATGTNLTFTTWIGDPAIGAESAAGYHVCLDRLQRLLDTGQAAPLEDHPVELEVQYAAAAAGGGSA